MKECVSYFRVASSGTLGSSDMFLSDDQPANEATIFDIVRSTACGNEEVGYRCLKMNLYSFVSIVTYKFLSTSQIVVSKEFFQKIFSVAIRCFYINSAPESNR